MHQLLPNEPIAEWTQPVLRVVVVDDDSGLVDVIGELFSACARLSSIRHMTSVNAIADGEPDLIIIASPPMRGDTLGAWDVVTLARAHRRLRGVPIIVLTTDVMAVLCDGRLAGLADVHLVEMPFDVDVIERVVKTAITSIDARRSVSQASVLSARRPI